MRYNISNRSRKKSLLDNLGRKFSITFTPSKNESYSVVLF